MHVQVHVRAKVLPSRLTLCDPVNCSPPGSSVHGILQARILGWVLLQGIFQTHGSNLGLLHCQADSLLSKPLGSAAPPTPAMPSQNPLNGGRRVRVRGRKISQPFLALKVKEAMSHGILVGSRCFLEFSPV